MTEFSFKSLFALPLVFVALTAQAYGPKTYQCANQSGVPNNIYTIQDVQLGPVTVPYVQAQLFFRSELLGRGVPIQESRVRGFANVVNFPIGHETLIVEQIHLEFSGDILLNCRPPAAPLTTGEL